MDFFTVAVFGGVVTFTALAWVGVEQVLGTGVWRSRGRHRKDRL